MILVYVTCKDVDEAQKISRHLLEKKLVACTNFFPVKSMYRWKGSVSNDSEVVLILKTLEKKLKRVEKEVKKIHSYECPCIASIRIWKVNREFQKYIKKETKD